MHIYSLAESSSTLPPEIFAALLGGACSVLGGFIVYVLTHSNDVECKLVDRVIGLCEEARSFQHESIAVMNIYVNTAFSRLRFGRHAEDGGIDFASQGQAALEIVSKIESVATKFYAVGVDDMRILCRTESHLIFYIIYRCGALCKCYEEDLPESARTVIALPDFDADSNKYDNIDGVANFRNILVDIRNAHSEFLEFSDAVGSASIERQRSMTSRICVPSWERLSMGQMAVSDDGLRSRASAELERVQDRYAIDTQIDSNSLV